MNKFIISEEERKRILNLHEERTSRHYLMEQETTGTTQSTGETQTISQMLQGKEFPGLTKQETDDTVYYSLFDPTTKKRLWWVSLRLSPNGWIETKVAGGDPKYFNMVETMYNSLNSFEKVGYPEKFDKSDPEMVFGQVKTKVDPQQVGQIFDTLVKSYNSVPKQ